MSRALALAAGLLVLGLAGCSSPTPVPPGLSDAEASAVAFQQQADVWASGDRNGVVFPSIAPVQLVTTSTWTSRQVTCLIAAGLQAREVSGGYVIDGYGSLSPVDGATAQAVCLAQYPVDPRTTGYLSDLQGLYMYDYFTQRLAPCLRLYGFDSGIAPDRMAYVGQLRAGIIWTPYNNVNGEPETRTAGEWAIINAHCPPLPAEPFTAYQPPVAG